MAGWLGMLGTNWALGIELEHGFHLSCMESGFHLYT